MHKFFIFIFIFRATNKLAFLSQLFTFFVIPEFSPKVPIILHHGFAIGKSKGQRERRRWVEGSRGRAFGKLVNCL